MLPKSYAVLVVAPDVVWVDAVYPPKNTSSAFKSATAHADRLQGQLDAEGTEALATVVPVGVS